jgi:hypothetical protein
MKKLPKKASRNEKVKYIFDEIQRKIIVEKDIVMSIFLIAALLLGHGLIIGAQSVANFGVGSSQRTNHLGRTVGLPPSAVLGS